MGILDGTEKLGSGEPTTTEAPAVDCPACGETVFAETIGDVSCDSCDQEFYAQGHRGESCTAVACDECGTEISFIQEHRVEMVDWELYYCHECRDHLAVQVEGEPKPPEEMLTTDWVFNGRSADEVGIEFGDNYWMKETQTSREQLATELLNSEARTADSSFNAYYPGDTDAYLCFTDDYCVGYITWNRDNQEPELGQLYVLPEFRRQGIGSGFVEAWRDDVVGGDSSFLVNNPNADMFRLLHSLGMVEVTDEGAEFKGFGWSGHWYDLPEEWKS